MTISEYEKPDWLESILVTPGRTNRPLLAAFITTFDPPQAEVLVQDLLPAWLELTNSYVDEGADKLRFYAELEDGLKRLRGRFTIVSSMGAQEQSGHGWIWRYISRLQIGFKRAAVQHAKLWMFHRAGGEGEPQTLEVIVSSQNLTENGFRDQIQAGWRCIIPLLDEPVAHRKGSWGVLPSFLDELRQACGPGGARTVPYWQELLLRAVCPKGATFVASVPGRHPTKPAPGEAAWGVAGLRLLGGSRGRSLTTMAPTIGHWNVASLKKWAQIAGLSDFSLSIAWVEPAHPWASHWQLNEATNSTLNSCNVSWLRLPLPRGMHRWRSPLCDEHKQGDTRWSHAKLYELGSNAAPQLLCTSANFSRAAWGDPCDDESIEIDNFELGVAIPAHAGLSGLPCNQEFVRATCLVEFEKPTDQPIAWMAAQWDGQSLRIETRLTEGVHLEDRVGVKGSKKMKFEGLLLPAMRNGKLLLSWPSAIRGVPLRAKLTTTDGHECDVAVEDLRPVESSEWLCNAGTPEEMQDAADQMLEEKYDFFDDTRSVPPQGKDLGGAPSGASYAVAAYEDSRRRFATIDHWIEIIGKADLTMRGDILSDGERIAERWAAVALKENRGGIAKSAALAAEELRGRVRDERVKG